MKSPMIPDDVHVYEGLTGLYRELSDTYLTIPMDEMRAILCESGACWIETGAQSMLVQVDEPSCRFEVQVSIWNAPNARAAIAKALGFPVVRGEHR